MVYCQLNMGDSTRTVQPFVGLNNGYSFTIDETSTAQNGFQNHVLNIYIEGAEIIIALNRLHTYIYIYSYIYIY